ncbi:MAG: DUF1611 domain-containing protein [Candidatus Eisenbacteria bacterium]
MERPAAAIVYCRGAFGTPNGKTAHGLVRFTRRYRVAAVVDDLRAGEDAGEALDGRPSGIPIVSSVGEAVRIAAEARSNATHLVVGLAPDGGRLSPEAREDVRLAIEMGLHVDSGLHDFLSEDPSLASLAAEHGVVIRDVRKPPPRSELHFFTGKIEEVAALKVAVLGTDSAVGKRTTAWKLVEAIERAGRRAEMIGTGQTAWMQGARYSILMDSLINDFVTGEIEHAVWSAWMETNPDVIVIEGQGSLLNPAYPGGFEILAAGRPDIIVLQDAPARKSYDGFPAYPMHPLGKQIQAVELVSGKPVVAIAINHEGLAREEIPFVCDAVSRATGLPAFDVLLDGAGPLAALVLERIPETHDHSCIRPPDPVS